MTSLTREILAGCACAQTGKIVNFYPANQTADVSLNSSIIVGYETSVPSQTFADGSVGFTVPGPGQGKITPITKEYPLFPSVPVVFLGGGGAALTFPVKAGDTCLLLFLDRDIDNWWHSGQTDLPPNTTRLHSLSDGIAIVGLRSLPGALPSVSTTDAQLYGPGGPEAGLISVAAKVGIGNASGQLKTAIDSLCSALIGAVIAGSAFNPATITAIEAAQAEFDAILK